MNYSARPYSTKGEEITVKHYSYDDQQKKWKPWILATCDFEPKPKNLKDYGLIVISHAFNVSIGSFLTHEIYQSIMKWFRDFLIIHTMKIENVLKTDQLRND